MSDQPQVHHVKMIPEPEEPTFMEFWIYDPLDLIAESFLRLSFGLFCLAVVVDIIENM